MATVIDPPMPASGKGEWRGPALSLRDMADLQAAPRRAPEPRREPDGTTVRVRSYEVARLPVGREHMYVEYDDGRDHLVARGGPAQQGLGVILGGERIRAGVSPASEALDDDRGGRVLMTRFIPGKTAQELARPAVELGRDLQERPRRYRPLTRNSNSYAADVAEPLFGRRPGDWQTPGAGTRLRGEPTMEEGPQPWEVLARSFGLGVRPEQSRRGTAPR